MTLDKKMLILLGLACGIMLFFLGMAVAIILGPTTETYLLPKQIGATIKLSGMGIICISMIIGGFFVEKIEKDFKNLLLIFGIIILLLNIFVLQYFD